MKSSTSAQCVLIDVCQMYVVMYVNCSCTAFWSGIANVIATSRMKPATTETTTDISRPTAAERDALCVSSDMCADAS